VDEVLSTECLISLSKLYFCFLELCWGDIGGRLGKGGGGVEGQEYVCTISVPTFTIGPWEPRVILIPH
jgi:hypothetical protein